MGIYDTFILIKNNVCPDPVWKPVIVVSVSAPAGSPRLAVRTRAAPPPASSRLWAAPGHRSININYPTKIIPTKIA